MIHIEDQVCSLELAQKLKELGVKQESHFKKKSYFYWVGAELWDEGMQSDHETPATPGRDEWISAFTVHELLCYLPATIIIEYVESLGWKISKSDRGFSISYEFPPNYSGLRIRQLTMDDDNIANAIAKTLIYLIENGYVKVEEMG